MDSQILKLEILNKFIDFSLTKKLKTNIEMIEELKKISKKYDFFFGCCCVC